MTMKQTLATASLFALIGGTASAQSVEQSVIDAIVADLSAQGFEEITIEIDSDEIDVDAYGADFEGDFVYSLAGVLLESDIEEEGSSDASGWEVEISYEDDEDDYEDDAYEDDDEDDSYDDDEDDDDDDDGDDD